MKINITKKEYKTLLEILEIADWILHAHETDESEDTNPYREFEQKIFALAKDFGYDHLIKYEKQLQGYFPTKEFEDTSPGMAFIEKFENESFWEDLTNRLVQRDLIRELGEKKILSLEPEDRMEKEDPYWKKYGEEFEAHGIDRLEIVSRRPLSSNLH
jgi:hypothetical protein